MAQYRRKPEIVDAISHDEFVQTTKQQGDKVFYKNHEIYPIYGHDTYFVPTVEGQKIFSKNDMLLTYELGDISPCSKEVFDRMYELIDDEEETPSNKFIVKFEFTEDTEEDSTLKVKDSFDLLGNPSDEAMSFVKTIYDTINGALKQISDAYPTDADAFSGHLAFGAAIHALKQGKCVTRANWDYKGAFLFMQVPSNIPYSTIQNMQSLPDSVKEEFQKRNNSIQYEYQIAIVYPDNTISGWAARPADILAEDWIIFI